MTRAFASDSVAAAFDAMDDEVRSGLLALRSLIFETADDLPRVGQIEEALRWGQPAYLTSETKSGTTIRLGVPKSGGFALFVHCQTSLIGDYITMFPGQDHIDGTRAVHFDTADQIDPLCHGWLIRRALTYHLKPA
jgi:hypothetical protein